MVAAFVRTLLWAALAAGLSLPVAAQSQSPQQQRIPAPDRHPATGLVFPPQISTAQKNFSLDYGKSMQRPELGYAWNYQMPQLLSATVYVYTMDVQGITDGPAGAPVVAQFQNSLQEIYEGARIAGRYEQLKTVTGPTTCPFGSVVFRCITLSGINSSKQHVFTALMVTGYRGNFLKLRLDWRENSELSQAAVDRFVQTLVGAMMR